MKRFLSVLVAVAMLVSQVAVVSTAEAGDWRWQPRHHGHHGQFRGHRPRVNNEALALGLFGLGVVVGSALSQPRPHYAPQAVVIPNCPPGSFYRRDLGLCEHPPQVQQHYAAPPSRTYRPLCPYDMNTGRKLWKGC